MTETVMVIEDEKEIRDLIRYNLERAGYRVHMVSDGEEGIRQVFASRPDVRRASSTRPIWASVKAISPS